MIGLGSYSFFWAHQHGLDLAGALRRTHDLGVGLFQICDYPPVNAMAFSELRDIRALAADLGIVLELGTRGLDTEHLREHLAIAAELRAGLLRSMVTTTASEAQRQLAAIAPELGEVTLALETYERLPTRELVALVETVAHPQIGICLDPANTVAILENPRDVIDLTASFVRNVHVKDFAFTRSEGWVGFQLTGCRLGEGLLDLDHLVASTPPSANRIVEHWLSWQGDAKRTLALEADWTAHTLDRLRPLTD